MENNQNTPAGNQEKLFASAVNGLVPLARAAEYLDYTTQNTLTIYARAGRIPGAAKMGRDWLLPLAWVLAQPAKGRTGARGPRAVRKK
jgi:hypothetical protein